jgi:hypothetical protein
MSSHMHISSAAQEKAASSGLGAPDNASSAGPHLGPSVSPAVQYARPSNFTSFTTYLERARCGGVSASQFADARADAKWRQSSASTTANHLFPSAPVVGFGLKNSRPQNPQYQPPGWHEASPTSLNGQSSSATTIYSPVSDIVRNDQHFAGDNHF